MAEFAAAGFFGKLPSRGDFVSRRLPQRFLGVWDAWLQKSLAASQAQLGSDWLETYLTSPVWCFALSAEVCGDTAYAGVMIPSVDRIGRYFPLTAAMPNAEADSTLRAARALQSWYARTEALLLEALDEPPLDLDALDARLERIATAPHELVADPAWPLSLGAAGEPARWHFSAPAGAELAAYRSAVLSHAAEQELGAYGVWWTAGSERVGASVLVTSGLPDADAFAAMLDGRWSERGWTSAALRPHAALERRPPTLTAAVSGAGKSRDVNEDAFAYDEDAGVWLVADGLGGHREGDVASRMVTSVVDHVAPLEDLPRRVERLADGLHVVNRCLHVLDLDPQRGIVASTVAALVLGADAVAFVWAGDSRVYRLRDGRLEQLTRDHAGDAAPDSAVAAPPGRRDGGITRAVGGEPELELEIAYAEALPGDRYLLCTDGVYSELAPEKIAHALQARDPQAACDELEARILDGPARDNLTAVVVQVGRTDVAGGPAGLADG